MKTKLERKIKMSNGGLRTIKEIFYRYAMKHQIKRTPSNTTQTSIEPTKHGKVSLTIGSIYRKQKIWFVEGH